LAVSVPNVMMSWLRQQSEWEYNSSNWQTLSIQW